MMMFYVDRIEDNLAVCEAADGEILTIPIDALPDGTREGSVLEQDQSGVWRQNLEEEARRRNKLFELQKDLFDE